MDERETREMEWDEYERYEEQEEVEDNGDTVEIRYDSVMDKYEDSWRHNFLGKVAGLLSAVAAVVAHVAHTFIANLVFGAKERYAISDTFRQAMRSGPNLKETDAVTNGNGVKEQGNDSMSQDISKGNGSRGKVNREAERPDRQYDAEVRDHASEVLLSDEEIRAVFQNAGLRATPMPGSDEIYLYYQTEEGFQKSVYGMSKTDLLNGNAKTLASALYAYSDGNKLECAMKAAATVAAVQFLANKEKFYSGQRDGAPMDLAYIDVKTEHGGESILIRGSQRGEQAVDVYFNQKPIATVTLNSLLKYTTCQEQIMEAVNKEYHKPYQIRIGDKDTITFEHTADGVSVRCNREDGIHDLGNYSFQTEADVRRLAQAMEEQHISPEIDGDRLDIRDVAYVTGMLSNPDMEADYGKDGRALSTFSGEPAEDGAAHIALKHTERGVGLYYYSPNSDGEMNQILASSYHSMKNITQQDLKLILNTVKDCRELIESNIYVAKDYVREASENSHEADYFDVPVIGDPEKAEPELFSRDYGLMEREVRMGQQEAEFEDTLESVLTGQQAEDLDYGGEAIDLEKIPDEDVEKILSGNFQNMDIPEGMDISEAYCDR